MEEHAGARINRRTFLQSAVILLSLMMVAGILTRILPPGEYDRVVVAGVEVVDPDSYHPVDAPDYPIWRWFTAPIEVLFAADNLTLITIILFILFVGGAFAVLDRTGVLRGSVAGIVRRFGDRKYVLLLVITLFFMLLGAMFGIFEEVVPLIPVMIALSLSLGWDSLVGLGMVILATNMGFSAAIANPFTVGVAQQIAGLPLFSGLGLRVVIFVTVYGVFAWFLTRYARWIDDDPARSPVYSLDQRLRHLASGNLDTGSLPPHLGRAIRWFLVFVLLILLVLCAAPFVPGLSSMSLPIVGLLFLIGGVGAGWVSGVGGRATAKAVGEGMAGIAPGIALILMAVSVKHIVEQGKILDTILHAAAEPFSTANPYLAVLAAFLVVLVMEVFVPSGSAKAFLMMPILVPLADLIGVTRQTMVLAYTFGDGFSNMMYPTNPVLLISLGLSVASFGLWIRWTARLWLIVLLLAAVFLGVAVAIGYGPY